MILIATSKSRRTHAFSKPPFFNHAKCAKLAYPKRKTPQLPLQNLITTPPPPLYEDGRAKRSWGRPSYQKRIFPSPSARSCIITRAPLWPKKGRVPSIYMLQVTVYIYACYRRLLAQAVLTIDTNQASDKYCTFDCDTPLDWFRPLACDRGRNPPLLSRRVCNGVPQTQNVGRSKEGRDAPGDEEASQIMAIALSGLHQHPPTHIHTSYLVQAFIVLCRHSLYSHKGNKMTLDCSIHTYVHIWHPYQHPPLSVTACSYPDPRGNKLGHHAYIRKHALPF